MATTNGYVFFLRNDPYSYNDAANKGINKDGVSYTGGSSVSGSETSSSVLVSGTNTYFSYSTAYAALAIDPSAQSYFFVDEQGVSAVTNGSPSTVSSRPSIRAGSTATGTPASSFLYTGPAYASANDYGSINDLAIDQANRRIYFTQSYVTGVVDVASGGRVGKPNPTQSGLFWISESGGTVHQVSAANSLYSPTVLALDLADNIAFVADVTGTGLDGGTSQYGSGNAVNRLTAVNLTTGAVQVLFSYTYHPDQTYGTDYYGGNVLDGLAVDAATHTLYYTTNNIYNPLYNDAFSDTQDGIYKVGFSVSGGTVTLGTTTTLYSGSNAYDPSRIEIDTQNGVFYVVGNTQKNDSTLGNVGPYDEAIYVGSLTANNTAALTRVTPNAETRGTQTGDTTDPHGEYFGTANQNPYFADNASIGFDAVPLLTAGNTVNYAAGSAAVAVAPTLTTSSATSVYFISATITLTGYRTGDLLAATTSGTAITATYGTGTGVLTLAGTDTVANYQSVLRTVTYRSTAADPTGAGAATTRTLTYSVNDGIATGTATGTVAEQTAPVANAGSPSVTFTGGGSPVAIDPALTVVDYTSANLAGATISITAGMVSGDTLGFTSQNGITGSYNATSGVLTLSGSATVAQYQAAVRSVTFGFTAGGNPTAGNSTSRTLGYTFTDGALTSTAVSSTLSVVHAPPTVSAGSNVTFTRGNGAVLAVPTAAVTAPDSGGTLSGATVSFISGFVAGDTLAATGANGITAAFNTATGTLTLSGTATAAQYQAVLDGIAFSTGNAAATGTRTLGVVVNDGTAASATATSSVNVVVPTPAIGGTAANQAVNDNATVSPFGTVTITDAAAETETATLTVRAGGTASDANGLLSGSGLTKTGVGTYTVSAATPASLMSLLRGLVFTPTAHEVAPGSTVTTGFAIALADAGGGSASDTATSVVATAVNTAPAITGTAAGQAVRDDATVSPFAAVTLSDPDVGASETLAITVTASGTASDANGLLSGTGLTKTGAGTYTLAAGAPGAVTAALRALVFTPTANQVAPNGTVTTGFTLTAGDGATTTSNAATTVVATSIADAPTITGTTAGQVTTDLMSVQPFGGATIGDVDVGAMPSVTITLRSGGTATDANGNLSGTGLSRTGVGTYVLAAASPATLTTELRNLVFSPTPDQVAPGQSVTTQFEILATAYGQSATDAATTVQATEVPCYCRGTRVLTERGEVAVEDLVIGDGLITCAGPVRTIRWIGTRSYAGRFAARNRDVLPVVFRAGSLSDGVPRRDLLVSPKHAMFLDNVLVPAEALINGISIVQLKQVDRVDYYHLELDSHDVIWAEGAASETFIDDNSRELFQNAAAHRALHPELVRSAPLFCAPMVQNGAKLELIRRRLSERLAMAGPWCLDVRTA